MIHRPVEQIVQENLLNAQRASQGSPYPMSECSSITAAWDAELKEHYQWLVAYDKGEKRKNAIIQLAGGQIDAKELFSRLSTQLKKTTIYEKMYDARKRPDSSTAEAAAQCLKLQGQARSQLLQLLGWHDAAGNSAGADRKKLLDDARQKDQWMGECGSSLERIAECLLLASGTMEKLRKNNELIDSYTAFRVLITLSGCRSVQEQGENAYHCFGIHKLEDGETDRIAVICARTYSLLYDCLLEQVIHQTKTRGSRREEQDLDWERARVTDAHRVFWGMMYRCLKKQDLAFRKTFSSAFFAKQNMESL